MNRMKHVLFLGALVALAGIGAQRAVADTPSLQDMWFNVNGSYTEAYVQATPTGVNPGQTHLILDSE
jgi:hypothetical protein